MPARLGEVLAKEGQVINFHRKVWHGALASMSGRGVFAVVDRIGEGPNLQEHRFNTPYVVEPQV